MCISFPPAALLYPKSAICPNSPQQLSIAHLYNYTTARFHPLLSRGAFTCAPSVLGIVAGEPNRVRQRGHKHTRGHWKRHCAVAIYPLHIVAFGIVSIYRAVYIQEIRLHAPRLPLTASSIYNIYMYMTPYSSSCCVSIICVCAPFVKTCVCVWQESIPMRHLVIYLKQHINGSSPSSMRTTPRRYRFGDVIATHTHTHTHCV